MMKFPLVILLAGIAFVIPAQAQTSTQPLSQRQPNVILMMADDLANEDLSCYRSERIQTPRIDQLATQGLRLTSYYAGNPVCSPSRMALLSGSYPARLGWRWGVLGYGFAPETGMSPKVYTIAEAFRDSGYRTAMSGKWHLGQQNMRPEDQGFDSAYYIHMSNNQNRDMYRDGEFVEKDWDNRLLTETFADEVIRVIREESEKPFFLYVPWTAPHFPADPHPDREGKSGLDKSAKYKDVVEELDVRIGQILDAIDETGKAGNTIVIFTSDNGRQPGQEGPNDDPPFRGRKWQSLEGGTRVPMIIRYPNVIPAGKEFHHMIAAIDLFPTLASACHVKIQLPEEAQKLDGFDAWGNLQDHQSKPARQELLFWHGKGQATAIRQDQWKLYFNQDDRKPENKALADGPVLYHLKTDPLETDNLAGKHPEKVEALLARAKTLLTDVYRNQVAIGNWPGNDLSKPPLNATDVWGKWIK